MINSAILIASKSQRLTNVKGETIRGIGLPFTQIIKRSKIKKYPRTCLSHIQASRSSSTS